MGYYINQRNAEFSVDPDNEAALRQALIDLLTSPGQKKDGYGAWGYSWVSMYDETTSLDDIFEAWRWILRRAAPEAGFERPIIGIEFEGEKYGDDDFFMDTIAPFVMNGSYIEMQGEEGEVWRWVFDHGKCETIYAKLVWD